MEEQQNSYVIRLLMDMNSWNDPETERKLKQYGKCENGRFFTRDVLVPADITLYALHFVIQKLYGFSNSHQRRFSIPDERLAEICDDKLTNFFQYVGAFLQFSPEQSYFLEDYRGGDFKVWLRKKYKGPYVTDFPLESYKVQQVRLRMLEKQLKPLMEEKGFEYEKMSIGDYLYNFWQYGDMRDLLMTIPLSRVLAPEGSALLDGKSWREHFSTESPKCFEYLSDVLNYEYDYGDSWEITITRPQGVEVSEDQIAKVENKHSPLCIAKDGFYLVDDVGGPDGYADFIACVFGGEESDIFEDSKDAYDWAHGTFGWSRRDWPPESML